MSQSADLTERVSFLQLFYRSVWLCLRWEVFWNFKFGDTLSGRNYSTRWLRQPNWVLVGSESTAILQLTFVTTLFTMYSLHRSSHNVFEFSKGSSDYWKAPLVQLVAVWQAWTCFGNIMDKNQLGLFFGTLYGNCLEDDFRFKKYFKLFEVKGIFIRDWFLSSFTWVFFQ